LYTTKYLNTFVIILCITCYIVLYLCIVYYMVTDPSITIYNKSCLRKQCSKVREIGTKTNYAELTTRPGPNFIINDLPSVLILIIPDQISNDSHIQLMLILTFLIIFRKYL